MPILRDEPVRSIAIDANLSRCTIFGSSKKTRQHDEDSTLDVRLDRHRVAVAIYVS
jgi:hypothetical protein